MYLTILLKQLPEHTWEYFGQHAATWGYLWLISPEHCLSRGYARGTDPDIAASSPRLSLPLPPLISRKLASRQPEVKCSVTASCANNHHLPVLSAKPNNSNCLLKKKAVTAYLKSTAVCLCVAEFTKYSYYYDGVPYYNMQYKLVRVWRHHTD